MSSAQGYGGDLHSIISLGYGAPRWRVLSSCCNYRHEAICPQITFRFQLISVWSLRSKAFSASHEISIRRCPLFWWNQSGSQDKEWMAVGMWDPFILFITLFQAACHPSLSLEDTFSDLTEVFSFIIPRFYHFPADFKIAFGWHEFKIPRHFDISQP